MGLGSYRPRSIEEELIITKHTMNIETGLLKNKLDHDIMVYRNEWDRENITKNNKKFLSTAVTFEGVVGERHNVAIIVPKGTNGAYVETISKFSEQREFLLNRMFRLIEISGDGQVKLFKVVNEDE